MDVDDVDAVGGVVLNMFVMVMMLNLNMNITNLMFLLKWIFFHRFFYVYQRVTSSTLRTC